MKYQFYYERNILHMQPPGATLFLTFRLAGSLPTAIQAQLRAQSQQIERLLADIADEQERTQRAYLEQKRLFGRLDHSLDTMQQGPFWLRDARVASLVAESMHFRDGKVYALHAFCMMPNHVHTVYKPLSKEDGSYHTMSDIMQSLKGYTAYKANQLLGRDGAFWQHESYDHVVRDEKEWYRIVAYVVNNPVKAGLVEDGHDWPWTYVKYPMS